MHAWFYNRPMCNLRKEYTENESLKLLTIIQPSLHCHCIIFKEIEQKRQCQMTAKKNLFTVAFVLNVGVSYAWTGESSDRHD